MHKLKTIFLAWLGFLIAVVLLAILVGIASYFGSDYSWVLEIWQGDPTTLVWLEDFTPIFLPSLVSLALLSGLLLLVYRVRPAAEPPEEGFSPDNLAQSRLIRWWVVLNGLAWLAAASLQAAKIITNVIPLPYEQEVSGGWRRSELSLVLMLFLWLAAASLLAIAQWSALAGVFHLAGPWAGYAAVGVGVGLAVFTLINRVVLELIELYITWQSGPSHSGAGQPGPFGISQSMIMAIATCLAAVYFSALFLAGAFAGWLQTGQPDSSPRSRWWLTNGLGMALGGLLGPFGGFIYGAVTAGRLQRLLMQTQAKKQAEDLTDEEEDDW